MIKCFIINLKRRKDRLQKISKHLKDNNLDFVRFDAIDAENESEKTLNRNISQNGPLGKISKGDLACFQSHYLLWKHISKNEKNLSVSEIIKKKDRSCAGKTLPASGLFFLGPSYDSKLKIQGPVKNLLDRFKI